MILKVYQSFKTKKMNAIQIAEIAESWVSAKMNAYIEKVAKVYSIPVEELQGLTGGLETTGGESASTFERGRLMKMKRVELQEKCRGLGHPVSGTKTKLVDRILSGRAAPKQSRGGRRKKPDTTETSVGARKSQWGNYVYDGLVIDKGTRMVVGEEMEDGTVGQLTRESIEKCHRHRLKFALPLNLNTIEEASIEEEEDLVQADDVDVEEGEEEEDEEDGAKSEEEDEDVEYVYEEEEVNGGAKVEEDDGEEEVVD